MKLTSHTDYALRTLMYLAGHPAGMATVQEIAAAHGIPRNHLSKVVHQLGLAGFVDTVRGRGGGLRLACAPESIRIGEVVRHTETDFRMAACFDRGNSSCLLTPACALKNVLGAAIGAYLEVLDGTTVADLLVTSRAPGLAAGQGAGSECRDSG